MVPLSTVVVRWREARRERSATAVRCSTIVATEICGWALKAVSLGWGRLTGIANWLRWVCERLDSVGVEGKIIEVRNLCKRVSVIVTLSHKANELTSSRGFTSSGCLLAICFSTKDVALKSF
jgi:hypothetical protein